MAIRMIMALILSCGALGAQAPVISPTTVTYQIAEGCPGEPTVETPPTLTAGGGSGSYEWTALTMEPPGLTLGLDGTFSGTLVPESGISFQFDVSVMDTVSMLSTQATITMDVQTATPGCKSRRKDSGDEGCSSQPHDGVTHLLLLAAVAAALANSVRQRKSRAGQDSPAPNAGWRSNQ